MMGTGSGSAGKVDCVVVFVMDMLVIATMTQTANQCSSSLLIHGLHLNERFAAKIKPHLGRNPLAVGPVGI